MRAIEEKIGLHNWYLQNSKLVNIAGIETPVFEFGEYFYRTMRKTAKGLYFKLFKVPLEYEEKLIIHSPSMIDITRTEEIKEINQDLMAKLQQYTWQSYLAGPHKVFSFRYWIDPKSKTRFAFHFCFYEGFHVLVIND